MRYNDYPDLKNSKYSHIFGENVVDGYRFVEKHYTKTPENYPYSYDPYYIFGSKEGSDNAIYSDRLRQWDFEADARAWEIFKTQDMTPETVAAYFNEYYKGKLLKKITVANICGLAKGCNVSNGYPYYIYFLRNIKFKESS